MSDCNEALREIYIFLDGELTAESRAAITAHLDGCTDCLEVFDFEAELRQVIAVRCQERAPESLRLRVAHLLASLSPGSIARGEL